MAANLVSIPHTYTIGGQDWTATGPSHSLGFEAFNESGLVTISGQIEIPRNQANPENIDPRFNVSRFRPGQLVRIQIRNSLGQFVDHPCGYLLILKEPSPPVDQPAITLDVGCWLSWMNAQGPPGDASGVSIGTDTNCAAIIQALLEADDIPTANINLGSLPYSLAYPLGKEGQGSYTAQAGQLAYANDCGYLYCDKDGVVKFRQLDFSVGSPVATVTLGSNDSLYQPFSNPASPADIYKASASGQVISPLANPITDQNVATGNASTLGPGKSGTYQVVTNFTDSYVYNPPSSVSRTSQVQVLAPPELIYLDPQGISGNGESWLVTETENYDPASSPHRLLSTVKTTRRPQGAFDLNANPKISPRIITTITTNFSYTNDLVTAIVVTQDDLEILHDELTNNPYNAQTVKKTTRTWTPQGDGEFKYNEETQVAAILSNPATDTAQTNLWALMVGPPSAPSPGGRGNNAPPATQYWEGPYTSQEQHYSGEATYTHPGGSMGRTRKKPITVPFGFSNAQCQTIATKHRDLAVGEYRQMVIKLPVTDALIGHDGPLPQINVVDPATGTTYIHQANGLSWYHTPEEDSVHCTGIWIQGGWV